VKASAGIRWKSSRLFKCTGAATEKPKTVVTDDNTVVLLADFYRQGDGNIESFTAHIFVSEVDEAPELPGIQNVWIEGVGCGHAIANFN
jgi:hypothetical protein